MTPIKNRFFFCITVLCCCWSASIAQLTESNQYFRFHSVNGIGLLNGELQSAIQLQTINGVEYKLWFIGIGLGIDYYQYRTIPFFLDLRKEFGRNRDKIFLYADPGINFGWPTETQKIPFVDNVEFGNKFYCDLGFGYKVQIRKSQFILLSLAYSCKKVTETYKLSYFTTYNYNGAPNPEESITSNLNRIGIRIGWEF